MSPEEQEVLHAALEEFLDEDVISEVLEVVRGGKEATVFRCRAGSGRGRGGPAFYAAKVYRPSERRAFRNDADRRERAASGRAAESAGGRGRRHGS